MKKYLFLFLTLLFLNGCTFQQSHIHTPCEDCGKCLEKDCNGIEDDKCKGHDIIHEHTPCEECGKCVDEDCNGIKEDKCEGHETIKIHTLCEECGKCLTEDCDCLDDEKCWGHNEQHIHVLCEECGMCINEGCYLQEGKCPIIHPKKMSELLVWYYEIEFLDVLKIRIHDMTTDDNFILITTTENEDDFENLFRFLNQEIIEINKSTYDTESFNEYNQTNKLVIEYGTYQGSKVKELNFYDNIIEIDDKFYQCNLEFLNSIDNEQPKYKFKNTNQIYEVYTKTNEYVSNVEDLIEFEFIDHLDASYYNFDEYMYYIKTDKEIIYVYDEYTFNYNGKFYKITTKNRFNLFSMYSGPVIMNAEFIKVENEDLNQECFDENDLENAVFFKVGPNWIEEKYGITIFEAKSTHVLSSEIYVVKGNKICSYFGTPLDENTNAIKMLAIADINNDGFVEIVISCTGEFGNKCLIFNTFNNHFDELYTGYDYTLSYKDGNLYYGEAMIKYGSRNRLSFKEELFVYKCDNYTVAYYMCFQSQWDYYLVTEENLGIMTTPSMGIVSKVLYTGEEFHQDDNPNYEFGENRIGPVPVFIDSEGNRITENAIVGPDVAGIDYWYPGLILDSEYYLFTWIVIDNIESGTYDMELRFMGRVELIEDFLIVK